MVTNVKFQIAIGPEVGLGHAMRCLNLATELSLHFDIEIFTHPSWANLPEEFERKCREYSICYSGGRDERSRANDHSIEIFDGYSFQDEEIHNSVENGSLIVRIDDRPGKYLNCDLLICHGPQARKQDFVVNEKCRQLLGPKYALINPCFYEHNVEPAREVRNLFIALGGGCSDLVLEKIISVAMSIQPNMKVEAMRGFWSEPRKFEGIALTGQNANVEVQGPVNQDVLAEKMSRADASITAGGGMCLETSAMGLPTFLIAISDNQISPAEAMHNQNLAFYCQVVVEASQYLDEQKLRLSLTEFLSNASLRRSLNKHCREFFNKSGVSVVVSEILSLVVDRGWATGSTKSM